nr:hypothetical protein [Tanacetum cinerariifolium]
MSEEDQFVDVVALPKFDMSSHESTMTAKDVKSLAVRHGNPLDLHLVALTEGWTMDKLPGDMIGLYEQEDKPLLRIFLVSVLFSKIPRGMRVQHTTPPLPVGQVILDKAGHQKEVEVEDLKIVATRERKARVAAKKREKNKRGVDEGEGSHPKVKRKKTSIVQKDGYAASEHVYSPDPLRAVNPNNPATENPSEAAAETA